MLGSVHDAEDVLQETLLRAWRGTPGLRDAAAARGWLYRIATNACLTEQSTLRALGDRGLQDLVGRYVRAWEQCDVDGFVSLLVEEASFAMPPLATWYTPRDAISRWARESSLSGAWR